MEGEAYDNFEQDIMHPNNCYQNSLDVTALTIENSECERRTSAHPKYITNRFKRCVCDLHLTCRYYSADNL